MLNMTDMLNISNNAVGSGFYVFQACSQVQTYKGCVAFTSEPFAKAWCETAFVFEQVEPIVRGIIDSFRKGDRDNVAVWLEKQGRPFYVNYMAVRDQNNNYIGTFELVQDMQFAKDHFARTK